MTLIELIQQFMSSAPVDEDGNPVELKLLPGLNDAAVAAFAATLPCPLPLEISELLKFCRGFEDSAVVLVEFTGQDNFFELSDIFPHGIPIAADGFGNFWVVDLTPASTTYGPIWFASHDPPMILYQCRDLHEFLVELFKLSFPPHKSLIDEVHEDRLFQVWRKGPGMLSVEQAAQSQDPVIRSFAAELDSPWSIIDLRQAEPGFGFAIRGPIRRYGYEAVFSCKQQKGFFQKLFRR